MELIQEISTVYGNIKYGTAGKQSLVCLQNDFSSFPKTADVWKVYTEKWIKRERISNLDNFVILNQVHGDSIHQVMLETSGDAASSNLIWEGDGLYTELPNRLLVVRTADCVPVFLYSSKRPLVAIIHSGWKGASLSITERMIEKVIEMGFSQEELHMEIGPYIQGSDYEVGSDVANFFSHLGEEVCFPKGKDKFLLDVGLAIEKRVKEKFQRLGGVENSHTNVYGSPLYFSHRAKEEGRNLNFILWES
ncbi:polyphenol oxidase family protein [Leptospira sp. 2 VSF19]|uniref:Polyphenol oxidase family protein n=1 Tax=Leptospira soteropolitanensis TaxID=2950025 RepID=A0AAW5VRS8_9LEPT|nr:polyphenol oxidase family protein [Leptospira soteropolitanensis]MCW7493751.1 polyphenol oxidase family protein [Leptospira soteropolitanensis]MCW7501349.1 polyphenol oxidase family protein [Leptospira soteropolitanensis]MCW7523465.1 polyphenol oxidase family protein [Leptospira soteropolitanensis]MCW7527463.1 polyphenol oxidase family protein [Leptospira soteropolitanensis]MCW7531319.1 polyphenol oxidase family protein [Leptospira soteropolitanensis]